MKLTKESSAAGEQWTRVGYACHGALRSRIVVAVGREGGRDAKVKECHVQPQQTRLVRGCGEAVVDSKRYCENNERLC